MFSRIKSEGGYEMFFRMIIGAFQRQWKKMLMIALTVALGASIATAMLNVMLDVGDKINEELKAYGSNITVVPGSEAVMSDLYDVQDNEGKEEYLGEETLGEFLTIFWANNITDFAPVLDTDVTVKNKDVKLVGTWFDHHFEFVKKGNTYKRDTGIINLRSWWDITDGKWLDEAKLSGDNYAMVGKKLAEELGVKAGDIISVKGTDAAESLEIVGIFESGDDEENYIFSALPVAQKLSGNTGKYKKAEVSAITSPDDELAIKAAKNPDLLSGDEYDLWYCTAYVSSICFQIQEAIPGASARAVRQIADSEGKILEKTELLMALITLMSLIGATLGISNLVTSSVMERSAELALMKAVGAKNSQVTLLVLTEIILTSLIGAAAGYLMGYCFAQVIGQSVFSSAIKMSGMVAFLVTVMIIAVTLVGSLPAIRMILRLRPSEVLHGGH